MAQYCRSLQGPFHGPYISTFHIMDTNSTLLHYDFEPSHTVKAFSSTRISPHPLSEEQLKEMGTYAAFNLTDYCGDTPERVDRNKQWLAQQLGITPDRIILPRQTHTDHIKVIDQHFFNLTAEERKSYLQDVDALITSLPATCIGISTADCVPVLIHDTRSGLCAAVHAGWRGTVQHIARQTALLMQQMGATAETMYAVIGPSISLESFEVGEEVVEAFHEAGFDTASIVSRPNPMAGSLQPRPHIDLWAANCMDLESAGLPLAHIQVSGICTYRHVDTFFSARRLGIQSGRIFSAIMKP